MHRIPVTGSRDTGRHPRMDRLDEDLEVLDRRVGQHAMPQVEDVAAATTGAAQHVAGPRANQVGGTEQHGRVEVALDPQPDDPAPSLVEWHAPVERNDVWSGFRYRLEQARGVGAEVDARHAQGFERGEDGARVAQNTRFVV